MAGLDEVQREALKEILSRGRTFGFPGLVQNPAQVHP